MKNSDGNMTNGIMGKGEIPVIGNNISEGYTTIMNNDVDGSITGIGVDDKSITINTFGMKILGGFLFTKITALDGFVESDLLIVG